MVCPNAIPEYTHGAPGTAFYQKKGQQTKKRHFTLAWFPVVGIVFGADVTPQMRRSSVPVEDTCVIE